MDSRQLPDQSLCVLERRTVRSVTRGYYSTSLPYKKVGDIITYAEQRCNRSETGNEFAAMGAGIVSFCHHCNCVFTLMPWTQWNGLACFLVHALFTRIYSDARWFQIHTFCGSCLLCCPMDWTDGLAPPAVTQWYWGGSCPVLHGEVGTGSTLYYRGMGSMRFAATVQLLITDCNNYRLKKSRRT